MSNEFVIREDWPSVLNGLLERGKSLGRKAIFAFDLDSTVFDNRPRQAVIVREYGQARNVSPLTRCEPSHWTSGWDMKAAMVNCGVPKEEVERLYPDAKKFWQERFFTSPYCLHDTAIDGASDYLDRVVAAGATLCYVTGRHEGMREGSVGAMRQTKMPLPDGDQIQLLMKPTLEADDDAFKREAHARLHTMGTVIAAFDNEPTHANDYRQKFPEALVVHLATDHSGRPVKLLPGIVSVPHFKIAR